MLRTVVLLVALLCQQCYAANYKDDKTSTTASADDFEAEVILDLQLFWDHDRKP